MKPKALMVVLMCLNPVILMHLRKSRGTDRTDQFFQFPFLRSNRYQ